MDGKITISASTLDEAITKALIELQTTSEHLHSEVVQKESAGLLGIFGKKPCIIRAHVMSEAEEKELAEAKKLGNPKVFNTIIIGVAAKHMDFDHDKWVEVIKATVPPKTVEMNLKAFEVGYAL